MTSVRSRSVQLGLLALLCVASPADAIIDYEAPIGLAVEFDRPKPKYICGQSMFLTISTERDAMISIEFFRSAHESVPYLFPGRKSAILVKAYQPLVIPPTGSGRLVARAPTGTFTILVTAVATDPAPDDSRSTQAGNERRQTRLVKYRVDPPCGRR